MKIYNRCSMIFRNAVNELYNTFDPEPEVLQSLLIINYQPIVLPKRELEN